MHEREGDGLLKPANSSNPKCTAVASTSTRLGTPRAWESLCSLECLVRCRCFVGTGHRPTTGSRSERTWTRFRDPRYAHVVAVTDDFAC
jgi:hypothetical protein